MLERVKSNENVTEAAEFLLCKLQGRCPFHLEALAEARLS